MTKKIKLGVFGLGVVGSGLVNIVRGRADELRRVHDVELEITKAVVLNPTKKRNVDVSGIAIGTDADAILKDEEINIVVELIGGIEPAGSIVKSALAAGKPVVSANKALIAEQGPEILALANKSNVPFFAEASVGGGIPILKTIRESLIANRISSVNAIINGTTNFILTKMDEEGLSYYEALKLAGDKGFAEADPTMDVEGYDAMQKLRILAAHIMGGVYPEGEILREGISNLTEHDFAFSRKQDLAIKLLAMARVRDGAIELRVHPTLIPKIHPMAAVRNEFNAIYLTGDAVGPVMLSGKGAGSLPTASAVYADIVDICTRTSSGQSNGSQGSTLPVLPIDEIRSEFYLTWTILDKPGVIGAIATILGKHGISVSSAGAELVPNVADMGEVDIVVHSATEKQIRDALVEIDALEAIRGNGRFIRIQRNL